ncbi:MAG: polysaccharide biosynthesis protein [Thermomicrobiales bacterium]
MNSLTTPPPPPLAPEAQIDWNTLLDRPPLVADEAALTAAFAGKRVLITGAGGSLGRELAQFVLGYRPAALTLVDSSEAGLFALWDRLRSSNPHEVPLAFRPADVRMRRRVAAILGAARPEIVFHLAAYKHVPWAEAEPSEYLDVNLRGGQAVIEEAARVGVRRIVYPSTDKAVNPPSLYGATKRIIEAHLRETATRAGQVAVAARFVNVLGTQGSVGVTFARQIAAGQPLSITDPAMARYWVTPRHGTLLLAYGAAPAFDEPFSVTLPEARPEVSVLELARRLWAALGHSGEPPIVVTGSRPGERLHEELTGAGETLEAGPYPGILQVGGIAAAPSSDPIAAGIGELLAQVEAELPESELKARALAWARSIQ